MSSAAPDSAIEKGNYSKEEERSPSGEKGHALLGTGERKTMGRGKIWKEEETVSDEEAIGYYLRPQGQREEVVSHPSGGKTR